MKQVATSPAEQQCVTEHFQSESKNSYLQTVMLLLSSDTAYQAQGCFVVFHVVESTDETIM